MVIHDHTLGCPGRLDHTHGRRRTVLGHRRLPIKGAKNGYFLFRNPISVSSAGKAFSANHIARISLFTKIFGAQHSSGKYPFRIAFSLHSRRRGITPRLPCMSTLPLGGVYLLHSSDSSSSGHCSLFSHMTIGTF